jgi:hypothetical protein
MKRSNKKTVTWLHNSICQGFRNYAIKYVEAEHVYVLFLCDVKVLQIAFIQLGYLLYYKQSGRLMT